MWGRGRCFRDGIDVEEHGARDVLGLEFGAGIAVCGRQVPGPIEDGDVGGLEMIGEPLVETTL